VVTFLSLEYHSSSETIVWFPTKKAFSRLYFYICPPLKLILGRYRPRSDHSNTPVTMHFAVRRHHSLPWIWFCLIAQCQSLSGFWLAHDSHFINLSWKAWIVDPRTNSLPKIDSIKSGSDEDLLLPHLASNALMLSAVMQFAGCRREKGKKAE